MFCSFCIDQINKPYLPIAAELLSKKYAWLIVAAALLSGNTCKCIYELFVIPCTNVAISYGHYRGNNRKDPVFAVYIYVVHVGRCTGHCVLCAAYSAQTLPALCRVHYCRRTGLSAEFRSILCCQRSSGSGVSVESCCYLHLFLHDCVCFRHRHNQGDLYTTVLLF